MKPSCFSVGHLVSKDVSGVGESVKGERITPCSSNEIEAPTTQQCVDKLTVGEQLLRAREKQNLSIEHIADQLKWSLHQIAEIEAGNYAVFHDSASVRGLVRAYAKIVKLDSVLLLEALSIEFAQMRFPTNALYRPVLDAPFPVGRMPWFRRKNHRSYRILGGLFLLAGCLIILFICRAELAEFIRAL